MSHSTTTAKLLVLPSMVGVQLSKQDFADVRTHFNPDGIVVIGRQEHSYTTNQFDNATDDSVPVVFDPLDTTLPDSFEVMELDGVQVVLAGQVSDLKSIAPEANKGGLNPETETYIVSSLLDLDVNTDTLSTSLEGASEYRDALVPSEKRGSFTHLVTTIESGYAHTWDELRVRGIGQSDTGGLPPISCFTLDTDGHTTVESLDVRKLGLRAIHGVGSTTADRLRKAGFTTKQGVADASVENLASIKGLGPKKGEGLIQNASALAEGQVIRTSETPLPGNDPVFVDIETDGLNPSIAWLIGVQDGIDGNYISFIQPDPDEPGEAVSDFMLWFSANASQRTLVAWNGWNFDFTVLREQITAHCPEYLDLWKRASKRDPLRWARDLDNAVLPGRTNKLEHVAGALGWDHDDTGLSGAAVGRAYRRWMQTREPSDELDWERHKRYCEDDVGALAFIYQEIEVASRLESTTDGNRKRVAEATSQGTLGDIY